MFLLLSIYLTTPANCWFVYTSTANYSCYPNPLVLPLNTVRLSTQCMMRYNLTYYLLTYIRNLLKFLTNVMTNEFMF